jgi:hypothetical protein
MPTSKQVQGEYGNTEIQWGGYFHHREHCHQHRVGRDRA